MNEDDLQRIQDEELANVHPGSDAELPLAARVEVSRE